MATLTNINGYIYDSQGQRLRVGLLRVTLQQDMVSVDGTKVAPFTIDHPLEPLDTPVIASVTVVGTAGVTTNSYRVCAKDGDGNRTLASVAVTTTTGNATQTGSDYNTIRWEKVAGAASYDVFGRTAGTELKLATVSAVHDWVDGVAYYEYNDIGDTPSGALPSENATYGHVYLNVYATVGASPAGLSYYVEYDPDPDDLTKPINQKSGYWRNYWAVPNEASVTVGSFVSALRGQSSANYMPISSVGLSTTNTFSIGPNAENSTKTLQANQVGANKPALRFNHTTSEWEFSNDGTTWAAIGSGGGSVTLTGDVTGTGTGTVATTASDAMKTRILGFQIGNGTDVITTGLKGFTVQVPYACTVISARVISCDPAVTSGSIAIDIWNDTFANFPPTDADSITGAAPVSISGSTSGEDTTLSGWDTSIAEGSVLAWNVDSVTDLTMVQVALKVRLT